MENEHSCGEIDDKISITFHYLVVITISHATHVTTISSWKESLTKVKVEKNTIMKFDP